MVVARTLLARARGAIPNGVDPDTCLVLPGARRVHTFGMRVALDVIFCDAEWKILHIERALGPRRFSARVPAARWGIEVSAGAADGLSVGDRLVPYVVWSAR